MMPAAELDTVREHYNSQMPDLCSIYGVASGTSTSMGHTETFTLNGTEPCRYAPPGRTMQGQAEQVIVGGVVLEIQAIVTMPANSPVTERNRLVVESAETGEIFDLEVVYVKPRTQEFQRRVLCRFTR